jgi:hypothetical protein
MNFSDKACPEVLKISGRKIFLADDVLGALDEAAQFSLRMSIEKAIHEKGTGPYICPLCKQTLRLRGGGEKKYQLHFAHPRDPNHKCPYKTDQDFSPDELAAIKYNGAKEGARHRQMKAWILQSLRCDESVRHDEIKSERRLVSAVDPKSWRVPDVFAVWKGRKIVFEVQLATTFVAVIAQRDIFYRKDGCALIWVLADPPSQVDRFTSKDIYYSNNQNIFVVNEETVRQSRLRQQFVVQAWWKVPDEQGEEQDVWSSQFVALDDLSFESNMVFYYNYEKEAVLLKESYGRSIRGDDRVPIGETKSLIFDGAVNSISGVEDDPIGEISTLLRQQEFTHEKLLGLVNSALYQLFQQGRIALLASFSERDRAYGVCAILIALASLERGAVVGSGFKNLAGVENWIYSSYVQHYRLFLHGVEYWRRNRDLGVGFDGTNSAAQNHVNAYKKERPDQDHSLDILIAGVFPELRAAYERLFKI